MDKDLHQIQSCRTVGGRESAEDNQWPRILALLVMMMMMMNMDPNLMMGGGEGAAI